MLEYFSPYFWGSYFHRLVVKSYTLPFPVISIGNIELGGAGKTPTVIEIGKILKNRGYFPIVLSRGYGRKSSSPCWIEPERVKEFSAVRCGDEPLLIASRGINVFVSSQRHRIMEFKKNLPENTVIILDDGFQNWKLKRHMDIVLLSVYLLRKGGYIIPFGRLREPLKALKRADLLLLNWRFWKKNNIKREVDYALRGKPVFHAYYKIEGIFFKNEQKVQSSELNKIELYGLSGIAHNKEFLNVLKKLGIKINDFFSFQDHSFFPEWLRKLKGYFVVSEKDFYRMPLFLKEKSFVVKIVMEIEGRERLMKLIEKKICLSM